MGFIFKRNNETIMLIHIPKNSGSYLRKKISSNKTHLPNLNSKKINIKYRILIKHKYF